MRKHRSLGVASVALCLAVSALTPLSAYADDNVAKAAVLSREAEKLLADGKTTEACDKLEQSQSLDPRGSTLLDLALCREKEGRLGTAYNLFEAAEKAALEEKRNDRVSTARVKKNALFAKLPRLTVTVPKEADVAGLEVVAGKQPIPKADWGKSYPVDAGDYAVTASAPGFEIWSAKVDMRPGIKRALTIGPLKPGTGGGPVKPPDGGKDEPKDDDDDDDKAKPDPQEGGAVPEPKKSGGPGTESGRFVFDIGALAGGHLSLINKAPQDLMIGTQYVYFGPAQSEFIASCGDTEVVEGAGECEATYNPQLALLLGGQIFAGWAFTEGFHFGGRAFGGAHIPGGWWVSGGPSISFKVVQGFWLGVNALVGTSQVEATVTGGKGSVATDQVANNAGEETVDIPAEDLAGGLAGGAARASQTAGLLVGGAAEVSFMLTSVGAGDTFQGSLVLSLWPTVMANVTGDGLIVSLPAGFSYRFY